MAKVSPVHSDVESGDERPHSKKNKEDEGSVQVDDGEEETEEAEYEIEAILDAKRGAFPDGRMGYFVKWKGYDSSENSWVDEQDAGNAEVLIEEYWKKHPKKAGRKSMDAKSSKKPRKSDVPEEPVESASTTKKRGRKSQPDALVTEDSRANKKAKKNGVTPKSASGDESHPFEEEVIVGNMAEHMHISDWEHLVDNIDTIERAPDGNLRVYFTLKTGERVEEGSELCARRFPQKLILFYESNLRWKSAGGDDDEP